MALNALQAQQLGAEVATLVRKYGVDAVRGVVCPEAAEVAETSEDEDNE